MPRKAVAVALLVAAGLLPATALGLGWDSYLDGPPVVALAALGGYAAGAWLPRAWAMAGVLVVTGALVAVNQAHDVLHHWLDDVVFFLVAVAGPAVAGAAVTTRTRQVRRLSMLQADLEELQRMQVAAARLEEQSRVSREVHAELAERIAGIAIRAEGARRADDATALAVIEGEARSILDRLRETLGSLRGDDRSAPIGEQTLRTEPRVTMLDIALPAALGAAIAVETAVISDARGPVPANAVAAFCVVAPLVLRRHRPVLAAACTTALGMAMSAVLTPIPETVTGVALLVVIFYSVGAWCRPRWWLLGWAVAALGTVGMEWVSRRGTDGAGGGDGEWIVLVWSVGAVGVGRVTAGWQERVRRTQAAVNALEGGRDAAVRLAVAREREVLASELHDTVAHAMTVVCVQAGAQQRVGGGAGDALRTIASVAERSLAELTDGLESLEQADEPLDRSRIAALGRRVGVDLEVDADAAGSGPAAAMAHRVIREAVVNVARHAPGAATAVQVRRTRAGLVVEIVDDGSTRGTVLEGAGAGLRGLAETIESMGGRLEWGPRQPRGFRVAALIPQEQR